MLHAVNEAASRGGGAGGVHAAGPVLAPCQGRAAELCPPGTEEAEHSFVSQNTLSLVFVSCFADGKCLQRLSVHLHLIGERRPDFWHAVLSLW